MELYDFDIGLIIWNAFNMLLAIVIIYLIVRFFLRRKK